MGLQNIDIGLEATSQQILELMESKANGTKNINNISGSYRNRDLRDIDYIMTTNNNDYDGLLFNYKDMICAIRDDTSAIYAIDKDNNDGGVMWKFMCNLPNMIDVHETQILEFRGELHLLGGDDVNIGRRVHYKYNGTLGNHDGTWQPVSELPVDFCSGKAIVFNNQIHILGGGSVGFIGSTGWSSVKNLRHNYHYRWDGVGWIKCGDLPYNAWGCGAFVMNNKLHMLGGGIVDGVTNGKKHYMYDGSTWTKVTDFSYPVFNPSICVSKSDPNIAYIVGGLDSTVGGSDNKLNKVVIYNGTNNTHEAVLTELPQDGLNNTGNTAVSLDNGDILILGKRLISIVNKKVRNGYNYIQNSELSGMVVEDGCLVNYRGSLHYFGGTIHREFSGGFWSTPKVHYGNGADGTIPNSFCRGTAVVLNDEIHLIGSSTGVFASSHYVWTPENGYVKKSTLPYSFYDCTAVIYNNEIHVLGGSLNSKTYNHYKFDGINWVPVSRSDGEIYFNNSVAVGSVNADPDNEYLWALVRQPATSSGFKYRIDRWDSTTGWRAITMLNKIYGESEIPNEYMTTTRSFLLITNSIVHIFNPKDDSTELHHWIFKGSKDSTKGEVFYGDRAIKCDNIDIDGKIALFYSKDYNIGTMIHESDTGSMKIVRHNISLDIPNIHIFLKKGQKFCCNKSKFIPILFDYKINDIPKNKWNVSSHRTLEYYKSDFDLTEDDEGYIANITGVYAFVYANDTNLEIDYHIK